MAILWAGGEDIDFPVIGSATIITVGGQFRSGWARCAISQPASGAVAKSNPFNGGAVTSAWLSFQTFVPSVGGLSLTNTSMAAFGLSGTTKGLGVGVNGSTFQIFKFDGTTRTVLASEGGSSWTVATLQRIDMQVTSYGATATVNVYLNGVSLITFTGDVTVSGMTNFDSVFIYSATGANLTQKTSELFVSDSDTRAIQGLQTLALTGAGTTTGWTNNTFSNINGINFSDGSPTSVNVVATDQQYTVTTPTPSVYSVTAVAISARMAKSTAATPTVVKLGYGNGAAGSFGTGASKTVTTGFQTYEQIDAINPTTSAAFTQAQLAALQLDIESA